MIRHILRARLTPHTIRILHVVASLLLVGMLGAAVLYAGKRGIAPSDYTDLPGLASRSRQEPARWSAPEGGDGRLPGLVAQCLLVLHAYGVWLMLTSRDTALHGLLFLWGAAAWIGVGRRSETRNEIVGVRDGLMEHDSDFQKFCPLSAGCERRLRATEILAIAPL